MIRAIPEELYFSEGRFNRMIPTIKLKMSKIVEPIVQFYFKGSKGFGMFFYLSESSLPFQ